MYRTTLSDWMSQGIDLLKLGIAAYSGVYITDKKPFQIWLNEGENRELKFGFEFIDGCEGGIHDIDSRLKIYLPILAYSTFNDAMLALNLAAYNWAVEESKKMTENQSITGKEFVNTSPQHCQQSTDSPLYNEQKNPWFLRCTMKEWLASGIHLIDTVVDVDITDKKPVRNFDGMFAFCSGDDVKYDYFIPECVYEYITTSHKVYNNSKIFSEEFRAKKSLNLACLLWAYNAKNSYIKNDTTTKPKSTFVPGMVVQLKSGGPPMTVFDTKVNGEVVCTWYNTRDGVAYLVDSFYDFLLKEVQI